MEIRQVAQILESQEYVLWNEEKFYESVQLVVVKTDNSYKFIFVPNHMIKELLLEKKTIEQQIIAEYMDDLKNWEKYADKMWDNLIFGNLIQGGY